MIRSTKDLWSGLIYVFFGATAIILGRDYGMGTALKMGAAYFPTLLGWLLVLIGVIALVRAFLVQGSPVGSVAIKGLLLVVGSVLLFGLLVRGAGMVVALPLLVVISALASSAFPLDSDAHYGGGSDDFLRVVFLKGLGIPLPVVGPGWEGESRLGVEQWIAQSCPWAIDRAVPQQFTLLLHRCVPRYGDRRTSRSRAHRHHRDAAAGYIRVAAGDRR